VTVTATWTARAGALALCAAALGGCASTPATSDDWAGGDPAHLAADKAACRSESAGVDVNVVDGYSDPRYGMTSAMAAAVAKDNPLTNTRPQIKVAAFAACMADKGWTQP
jgi:hypothetical protein